MADKIISWRLHLNSPPEKVYAIITTDEGRRLFWAESTATDGTTIHWVFPDNMRIQTKILASEPPHRFILEYYGGSQATFELAGDGNGGTDLTLSDQNVRESDWEETHAGWVSVLMALKAQVDFGIDLRNHDSNRTWSQGYVDN